MPCSVSKPEKSHLPSPAPWRMKKENRRWRMMVRAARPQATKVRNERGVVACRVRRKVSQCV